MSFDDRINDLTQKEIRDAITQIRGEIAFLNFLAFESFRRLPRDQRADLALAVKSLVTQMGPSEDRVSAERLVQKLLIHLLQGAGVQVTGNPVRKG